MACQDQHSEDNPEKLQAFFNDVVRHYKENSGLIKTDAEGHTMKKTTTKPSAKKPAKKSPAPKKTAAKSPAAKKAKKSPAAKKTKKA